MNAAVSHQVTSPLSIQRTSEGGSDIQHIQHPAILRLSTTVLGVVARSHSPSPTFFTLYGVGTSVVGNNRYPH